MWMEFCTSLSCMDGRVQEPIREWITKLYGQMHVDTITQPGMDKVLADGGSELVKKMVGISINAHGSGLVVVSGHHDCAGNPVGQDQHIRDIKNAVENVAKWCPAKVVGVWVDQDWKVERVAEPSTQI